MFALVPATSLPPELLSALLEQGGPTVAAVAILWWRLNKLEDRFSDRLDRLDEDVSANSGLIYDRLLGRDQQEYPTPDRADQAGDPEPARSSSD